MTAPDHAPAAGAAQKHAAGKRTAPYGTRKSSKKSPRSRSREFALQGLYQHFVGASDAAAIDAFTRNLQGFSKADAAHFDALLHGCLEIGPDLDALIMPALDRRLELISPVEHACMWIGAYELLKCPDVPWRVVLDESIELSKDFGGTDGYKYVNAVLNAIAPRLRPAEVAEDRSAPTAS